MNLIETDTYFFEGEEYEGNWEILEILLERKINNKNKEDENIR